jgi:hypothetical protein
MQQFMTGNGWTIGTGWLEPVARVGAMFALEVVL